MRLKKWGFKNKGLCISLAMALVTSLSLTGCDQLAMVANAGKTTQMTNKSAKELLMAAKENSEKEEQDSASLKNMYVKMSSNIDLSGEGMTVNVDGGYTLTCGFGDNPTMSISADLNNMKFGDGGKNDLEYKDRSLELAAIGDGLVFTLDGKNYNKLSYDLLDKTGIVDKNMVSMAGGIMKNMGSLEGMLDGIVNISGGLAGDGLDIKGMIKDASSDSDDANEASIFDSIIDWSDSFKVDGTKEIDGVTVNVIKGEISFDNIFNLNEKYSNKFSKDMKSSLMGDYVPDDETDASKGDSKDDSKGDSASVDGAGISIKPIKIEIYVSDAEKFTGYSVDMADCLGSVSNVLGISDVKACSVTCTSGVNNAKLKDYSGAKDASFEDLMPMVKELLSMLGLDGVFDALEGAGGLDGIFEILEGNNGLEEIMNIFGGEGGLDGIFDILEGDNGDKAVEPEADSEAASDK